jgi:hypothetical protein
MGWLMAHTRAGTKCTARAACIVLQPETSLVSGRIETSIAHMNKLHGYLNQFYGEVRLIPQTHKQLGVV